MDDYSNKILLVTASDWKEAHPEFSHTLQQFIDTDQLVVCCIDKDSFDSEIRKRPKAVLIDGWIGDFEKYYDSMMSCIHRHDIPLLLDLYCFGRALELRGVQFIGRIPNFNIRLNELLLK